MEHPYKVENTTHPDLEFIFGLFDESIAYQKKNGYIVWEGYDKNALINDVRNGHQYKVVIDGEIAIVFSVCYSDKIIWRAMEKGDALYLHRIVVNPAFKGKRLFGIILDWATDHAKQKTIDLIRMDTWGDNANIIAYYQSFGFTFIENFITPDVEELPVHNRNLNLALLQKKVNRET